MAYLAESGQSLKQALKGMVKLPQVLINVALTGNKDDAMQADCVKSAVADVEAKLAGRGRVLLRPSGTEPLIRVMVEGEEAATVRSYAEQIAEAVKSAL